VDCSELIRVISELRTTFYAGPHERPLLHEAPALRITGRSVGSFRVSILVIGLSRELSWLVEVLPMLVLDQTLPCVCKGRKDGGFTAVHRPCWRLYLYIKCRADLMW
jgi:hypothetical protein